MWRIHIADIKDMPLLKSSLQKICKQQWLLIQLSLLWYHVWTWWVITLTSSINEMIFYWYYLPYLLWWKGDGRCSCCHGQWWIHSTSRTSYGFTLFSSTCSPICCTSCLTQGSLRFCLKLDNLITLSTSCVDQLFDDRSFVKLPLLDIMP